MIPLHDRTTYSWNSDIVGIHSFYWHMRIFTYIAHYKVHYFYSRFTLFRRESLEHFALFRLVQPSNLSILNINIRCTYVYTATGCTYICMYTQFTYLEPKVYICMYIVYIRIHMYLCVAMCGWLLVYARLTNAYYVRTCVYCRYVSATIIVRCFGFPRFSSPIRSAGCRFKVSFILLSLLLPLTLLLLLLLLLQLNKLQKRQCAASTW